VADKPDSTDICFVRDGDTAGFLRRALGDAPGEIVEVDGTVVGRHDGAFAFTVGQRRGLRLGRPAPDGRPRYVLDVSPVDRRVTVGSADELDIAELVGVRPRWCGVAPSGPLRCAAQVRAHGTAVPAVAVAAGDEVSVRLDAPQRGVAPGQAVVLYDGSRVVGSATIARTSRGAVSVR
jgi:tRNA-specific 2-thiouridylase